jgi:hypothetical protein
VEVYCRHLQFRPPRPRGSRSKKVAAEEFTTPGWSATGSWPETGLEEINVDVLEGDFWPASSKVCAGGITAR